MDRHNLLYVFVCVWIFGVPALSAPASPVPLTPDMLAKIAAENRIINEITTSWGWTNEAWSGDDRPFVDARNKIDTLFSSGRDVQPYIDVHRKKAIANPQSAICQFEWAYASYIQYIKVGSLHGVFSNSGCLLYSLETAQLPHTYNYDRLMFLIRPDETQEVRLARRLLKREPDDPNVKFAYADTMLITGNPTDEAAALAMAKDLESSSVNKLRYYFFLGYVYCVIADRRHSAEYYKNAISANDLFLGLAGPDDTRRQAAIQVKGYLKRQLDALTN